MEIDKPLEERNSKEKLTVLAHDCLLDIVDLLSGYDVTRLWYTGDKELHQKMKKRWTRRLSFSERGSDFLTLPCLVSDFEGVESLSLIGRSFRFSNFNEKFLSTTLKTIEIDSDIIFIQFRLVGDSLASVLPSLQSISVKTSQVYDWGDYTWPDSLTRLSFRCDYMEPECGASFAPSRLPRGLTSFACSSTKYEKSGFLQDFGWPEDLTELKIAFTPAYGAWEKLFRSLPKLISFRTFASHPKPTWELRVWAELPIFLKSLVLAVELLPRDFKHVFPLLPKSLTKFCVKDANLAMRPDQDLEEAILLLPRSITHLDLSIQFMYCSRPAYELPTHIASLLPRTLTRCGRKSDPSKFSIFDLRDLPPSLIALRLAQNSYPQLFQASHIITDLSQPSSDLQSSTQQGAGSSLRSSHASSSESPGLPPPFPGLFFPPHLEDFIIDDTALCPNYILSGLSHLNRLQSIFIGSRNSVTRLDTFKTLPRSLKSFLLKATIIQRPAIRDARNFGSVQAWSSFLNSDITSLRIYIDCSTDMYGDKPGSWKLPILKDPVPSDPVASTMWWNGLPSSLTSLEITVRSFGPVQWRAMCDRCVSLIHLQLAIYHRLYASSLYHLLEHVPRTLTHAHFKVGRLLVFNGPNGDGDEISGDFDKLWEISLKDLPFALPPSLIDLSFVSVPNPQKTGQSRSKIENTTHPVTGKSLKITTSITAVNNSRPQVSRRQVKKK